MKTTSVDSLDLTADLAAHRRQLDHARTLQPQQQAAANHVTQRPSACFSMPEFEAVQKNGGPAISRSARPKTSMPQFWDRSNWRRKAWEDSNDSQLDQS